MNLKQAKKVQRVRKKLGLTRAEMADAMGTPYDTFKDWDSGRRNITPLGVRCMEMLIDLKDTDLGVKYGV